MLAVGTPPRGLALVASFGSAIESAAREATCAMGIRAPVRDLIGREARKPWCRANLPGVVVAGRRAAAAKWPGHAATHGPQVKTATDDRHDSPASFEIGGWPRRRRRRHIAGSRPSRRRAEWHGRRGLGGVGDLDRGAVALEPPPGATGLRSVCLRAGLAESVGHRRAAWIGHGDAAVRVRIP